jgi:hypothetical protein
VNRRRFLAGAALLPFIVRRAFADSSIKTEKAPPSRRAEFAAALERAKRAGVPLLVLIVPTDDAKKCDWGYAWGELINHGTPEQVAPLGTVEVVCAGLGDLGTYGAVLDSTEPLAMVLDPKATLPARVMQAELPQYEERHMIRVKPAANAPPPKDDAVVANERIALLASLLRANLPAVEPGRVPALARVVATKLKARPPQGSHWATGAGCSTEVEPTPEEIAAEKAAEAEALKKGIFRSKSITVVGCGMGHVPEKSRRFLYFFSKSA